MRLDLPSTGNSGGLPRDPARLDSWLLAIAGGVGWLCESTEVGLVSAVGIGLGGLLAREAIARGAPIDELALWGAPASGEAFVREVRAFSRLQPWSSEPGADTARRLGFDSGAIEAGGFVLSAETVEALRELAPDDSAPSGLRRALLLGRDGVAVDDRVREAMSGAGVEVTLGAGSGWGAMMSHPERSRMSSEVAQAVEEWLEADAESVASTGEAPLPQWTGIELGDGVIERAWAAELPFGRAFGVLAEPAASPAGDTCAVFLNAGAVRMSGPNRMWTDASRRWAKRGMRTLRVDLEGIGEADGDETRFTNVGEFYVPAYEDQVRAVLDRLEAEGAGTRFLLVGLCAGGYWAFRTAVGDGRVSAAVLLNAGALAWHSDLPGEREARKLIRVRGWRLRWWKGLLTGEIGWGRLRRMARLALRRAGRVLARVLSPRRRLPPTGGRLDLDFDRLEAQGTRLIMAFSGDEPLEEELRAEKVSDRLAAWSGIELNALPGSDHTLRPAAAQIAAADLLDRVLLQTVLGEDRGEGSTPHSDSIRQK